jgi:hypothetical protein
MNKFFAVGLVCLALTGCDRRSVETSINPDTITYQVDSRVGLCYAVVGYADASSLSGQSKGFAITNVPCETVKRFLK